MNQPYDEQVSALLDGELAPDELQRVLGHMRRNRALASRIGRYALIRDALHRSLPPLSDDGLADRISEAISRESAHSGAAPRARRYFAPGRAGWMRTASGLAIAASVAVLAIVVWPVQQPGVGPESGEVSTVARELAAPSAETLASRGSEVAPERTDVHTVSSDDIQWDRLDPDVQARLAGYAMSHGEQSSGRQMGIVPRHVRIVGQESGQ